MRAFNPSLRLGLRLLSVVTAGCLIAGCLLVGERPKFYRCTSQQDCTADEICDLSGGTIGSCYPIGYCRFDSECGLVEGCVNERCTPVQCTPLYPTACREYSCATDYTCRTSCTGNGECQRFNDIGHVCEAGACVPAECESNRPCTTGFACEYGKCRTDCTSAVHCADAHYCISNVCKPDFPD